MTIQIKAIEQYYHVILFVFPYIIAKWNLGFFSILSFDTLESERVNDGLIPCLPVAALSKCAGSRWFCRLQAIICRLVHTYLDPLHLTLSACYSVYVAYSVIRHFERAAVVCQCDCRGDGLQKKMLVTDTLITFLLEC